MLTDADPERARRVFAAIMKMKKIDVAKLTKADGSSGGKKVRSSNRGK